MISHNGWSQRDVMIYVPKEGWMSKHDEAKPGTITAADLREALRVNRALEHAAQADVDYADKRVAREHELIHEAQVRIAEHEEDRRTAPERLARIRERIARQESELSKLETTTRSTTRSTNADSKNSQIEALTARIVAGDTSAIAELIKLTKK